MATRPSNLIVMSKFPGLGSFVMRGLDPRIHQKKNSIKAPFLISDGFPGQARQ